MRNTILTVIGLLLFLGGIEALFPAERGQSVQGRVRNLFYIALFLFAGGLALGLATSFLPLRLTVLADGGAVSTFAIVLLYLFLSDFIFYWYHRAQHRSRWLWPVHELHHSDRELNATSSMRTYWLERPVQTYLIVAPVNYFLGLDPMATLIVPFAATGWLFFTHANIRFDLGFLTPVIAGPQLHRIHHSILPQHQGKNFAQFFPVFDLIFGTYHRPSKDEYPPTGIPDVATDIPTLKTLVRPIRLWAKEIRR